MSESLESLNDLAFDLDDPSDFGAPVPRGKGDSSLESASESSRKIFDLAFPVRTLTNSPGCRPASSTTSSQTKSATLLTKTNRPADASSELRPSRRVRTVRVDAWSVPASANWGRKRTGMRKVNRVSRSTDWALPF